MEPEKSTEELGFNPETIEEDKQNLEKMFCFLNDERVCGGDCMAFITFPRSSEVSELGGVQVHCSILQSLDRLGRNITILASTLVDNSKRQKTAAQDAQRMANVPMSGPSTSPFPRKL